MEERLCTECVSQNQCWFVTAVNIKINALPPTKDQTLIILDPKQPNIKATQEAFDASKEIADKRIEARERMCPQANYNPQNPKFQPNL